MTFFGRDKNHTVCGTCTVNRTGSRILQYGNILNVIGIDVRKFHFHSIYQNIWSRIPRQVSLATQGQCTRSTRSSGIAVAYGQARHHPLQALSGVSQRTGFKGISFYRRNGTGKIYFLLYAITHYHYFIQLLCIAFHHNPDVSSVPCEFHILVAYIRNDHHSPFFHIWNRKTAIQTRDGTIRRTFYQDRSTDYRFSRLIQHYTFTLTFLLRYIHSHGLRMALRMNVTSRESRQQHRHCQKFKL